MIDFKEFLEKSPLYKKTRGELPRYVGGIVPDVLELSCPVCRTSRPFHGNNIWGQVAAELESKVYEVRYACQGGCNGGRFFYWMEVNIEDGSIRKVGQLPMWLPEIPKDIEKELGEDAELYKKALRNMNEGYGIGACAYLRRLLEKYINPLLQLLHDTKQDQGAGEEELVEILRAIEGKDFTTKTKFAADIAPASIIVDGFNPLKELHDKLSVGLHTLDEETANQFAAEIRDALEFIVRQLRRQHEERKSFVEKVKAIRNLKA